MNANEADRTFLAELTALYVEDSPVIRSVTSDFLKRRVGKLLIAEDGVEGLETFQRERPHLVITDVMMPRMDGLEMAEAIKIEAPETPVVVITAFEQTQFLMRAITIGVDRYVMKPVQPELLESALLHCAHQLRAEEELRQHHRVERDLALARHHEALCILAKGIAHDYNNLLQAILTSVETASLQTPAGSPAHLILGMTQRFTDLAQQLGQQLLVLGQVDDQFDHRGSLAHLLESALNEAIKGTGIVANTAFPADFPSVRYNGERLAHAITLLLTNAREAMPQGGSLELSAELREITAVASPGEPAPGTYLHVGIKDSGVGISVELLPRIFDPYFSSKALGSKKGQGLSLALCRSIILAHSGFITAESKVGEGSTFHIYLPVDPPTAA